MKGLIHITLELLISLLSLNSESATWWVQEAHCHNTTNYSANPI